MAVCSNNKSVVFLPNWSQKNPYQNLLIESLSKHGISVQLCDFPSTSFPLNKVVSMFHGIDIIHLHWVAPYFEKILWSPTKMKFFIKLILLCIDLLFVRMRGRRLVWTIHNYTSHESPDPKREILIRRILSKFAHKIIFHSDGAKKCVQQGYPIDVEKKVEIIPHGNYLGVYPRCNFTINEAKKECGVMGATVFLFFGAIRRYKGLNELVNSFKTVGDPNIRLLIAGGVVDKLDRNWLENEAKNDNRIILSLGFVPDSDVGLYMRAADVVVLPFIQTLTSGSLILAMTYGKPVILPELAKIFDIPGQDGAVYYSQNSELASAIKLMKDKDIKSMGEYNYNVVKSLDWSNLALKVVETCYSTSTVKTKPLK